MGRTADRIKTEVEKFNEWKVFHKTFFTEKSFLLSCGSCVKSHIACSLHIVFNNFFSRCVFLSVALFWLFSASKTITGQHTRGGLPYHSKNRPRFVELNFGCD